MLRIIRVAFGYFHGYVPLIVFYANFVSHLQGLTNPSFSHLPDIPQHLENGLELQYSLYILYIFLGK